MKCLENTLCDPRQAIGWINDSHSKIKVHFVAFFLNNFLIIFVSAF